MIAALDRHPNAKAVLTTEHPSHAYLFYGPGGAGKREIARELAAAWLSDGAAEPESAHARALSGSHPDLTWVTPSGAHEVLVSDIDEAVIAACAKTPFEANRRVFVIEGAAMLGDQAANKLLKTLEEPPAYAHLILITDDLAQVMPTIRSRCQTVRFEPLPERELSAQLQSEGIGPDTADALARLGLGDAGRARTLAEADGQALREQAITLVRATLNGSAATATAWKPLLDAVNARGESVKAQFEQQAESEIGLYPKKEQSRVRKEWDERIKRGQRRVQTGALDQALTLAESWLLDLSVLGLGAADLVRNRDRIVDLKQDLETWGGGAFDTPGCARAVALRDAVEIIEDTRQRLQLNVTEELACEALTYRLERVLAG
jgi:DNA polymerase III subunit delta'